MGMVKECPIEAIKIMIKKLGITDSAMAETLEISKGNLSDVLKGKKDLPMRCRRLANRRLGINAKIMLMESPYEKMKLDIRGKK